MKNFKQALKLLALVCLIVLAGFGVGLSGGVPIPSSSNKRDAEKENTALVENQDESSEAKQGLIKQ